MSLDQMAVSFNQILMTEWRAGMRVWCGARLLTYLMASVVCVSGCGPGTPKDRNPTQDRLYKLGKAYLQACYGLGHGPASFEEVKDNYEGELPDDLLVSPRDRENFVIFWGVDVTKLRATREDPFTVAGYEKHGADGTRYVLRFPISIVAMTDEKLHQAVFPPGHKAPD
jgi:hypothetical protein